MPTTTGHSPAPTMTAEQEALCQRWFEVVPRACLEIPAAVLLRYFQAAQAGSLPLTDSDIVASLDCGEADAVHWANALQAWMIAPQHYNPYFAAEDALTDARNAASTFEENAQVVAERLNFIRKELVERTGTACLSPAHEQVERPFLDALEDERLKLFYRATNVFPDAQKALITAVEDANAQLDCATETVNAAYTVHRQRLEDAASDAAVSRLQPVLAVLADVKTFLDVVAPGASGRIREALVQAIRA